jgi:hypothetical protein
VSALARPLCSAAASARCDWLCHLFLPAASKHASVAHSAAGYACQGHVCSQPRPPHCHHNLCSARSASLRLSLVTNRVPVDSSLQNIELTPIVLLSSSHYLSPTPLHAHAHPQSLRLGPPALNPWHLLRALAVHASTKQDDIRGFLFEHH